MRATLTLALVLAATSAFAEPQAPELQDPDLLTDIWGPLTPLPTSLRPDVAWDKLLAGCTERKVVRQDGERGPTQVAEDVHRGYDKSGHVTRIQRGSDTTLDFTYDGAGRLARRVESYAGSGSIHAYTLTHTYTYDDAGRVQHVTKEGGGAPDKTEMSFTYDAGGRLVRRADDAQGKAGWAIARSKTGVAIGLTTGPFDRPDVLFDGVADDKGRLARLKAPHDHEEDILVYDAAGREIQRTIKTADATEVVTLEYDRGGRLVKIASTTTGARSAGTLVTATYNAAGRMIEASSSKHEGDDPQRSSSEAQKITFSYDDDGRLAGEQESYGGGSGGHGFTMKSETVYRYAAGRLVEVKSHATGYPQLDRITVTTFTY